MRTAGLVALALAWGTQFLVIKAGLETVPPLLAVALRYALLAVVGQVALLISGAVGPPGTLRWRCVFGVAQAGSMGLLYWAQGHLPSAVVGILAATTPFMVAVLASAWLGEDGLKGTNVISTALGFLGVAWIAWGRMAATEWTLGAAAIFALLASSALDAVNKVTAKRLAHQVPVPVMLRDMGAVVAVTAGVASWVLEGEAARDFNAGAVAAVLYLGLVPSAAASGLYLVLLRRFTVSGLAYLQFVTALVALLTGVTLGREQPGPHAWAGAVAILAGLAWRGRAAAAPAPSDAR